MLIEQILKEAEAIRDIFQLFNQYPEYQRLFTQQYQIVRTQDPTADEPTVVGLAQERTGMILRSKGIDLDTKSMRGTDIVTQLNQDSTWSELKQDLKDITKKAQAETDRRMQNITGQGNTSDGGFRRGSDGRTLRDPRYYRDRTIGDVIGDTDTGKAIQGIGSAMSTGSVAGGAAAGKDLANAVMRDAGKIPGVGAISRGIKDYSKNSLKNRPQYQR
jgi:hypothetical protein